MNLSYYLLCLSIGQLKLVHILIRQNVDMLGNCVKFTVSYFIFYDIQKNPFMPVQVFMFCPCTAT